MWEGLWESSRCPMKHNNLGIVWNVFFHNLLWGLIPKTITKYYNGNHIIVNFYFSKNICKKPLIFNSVCGRRHSKLFTNCHVSWDTLYIKSTTQSPSEGASRLGVKCSSIYTGISDSHVRYPLARVWSILMLYGVTTMKDIFTP